MSNFGPQESLDFWNECVQNGSLFDLMSDPRIRMVSCRDYILDKQKRLAKTYLEITSKIMNQIC